MRISDWSSDVCSSDLFPRANVPLDVFGQRQALLLPGANVDVIASANLDMDLAYVLAKDIVKRARLTREVWAANQHDRCRLRYEVSLEDVRGRIHDPRHLRERWKLRELIAMERVPEDRKSTRLNSST